MKISDLLGRNRPVFSFEFFPPKTDEAARELMRTVGDLREKHAPDFVSVTYGAGGTTRDRTLEVVSRIQNDLGITAMAHLTCVGHSRDELHDVVSKLQERGIENVLALRGDPPQGSLNFERHPDGFGNANELVAFLAERFPISIGGACYPEAHPESPSVDECLRWTKVKVDAGAEFLVTQLFFDNADYFDFVARARAAGIDVPIVPGIMPVTNLAQIERFTKMCGAKIPAGLRARLDKNPDDPARIMATGLEHAIEQCQDLLDRGAPGLHFYTLNKSAATRTILAGLVGRR